MSRSAGGRRRRLEVRNTGPGPGAGLEPEPGRAPILNARIAIVATIVVGQLWALTVALNTWFSGGGVGLLVVFQGVSFIAASIVWLSATAGQR